MRRRARKVKSAFGDEAAEIIDFALPAGTRVNNIAVAAYASVGMGLHIKTVPQVKTTAFLFEAGAHPLAIAEEQIDDLRSAHGKASNSAKAYAFRTLFLNPADLNRRRSGHRGQRHPHDDALLNRHLCNLNVFDRRGRKPSPRRHQRKKQQSHSNESISIKRCVSTVELAINSEGQSLMVKDVDPMNGEMLAPRAVGS